jgi:hypothetical protein
MKMSCAQQLRQHYSPRRSAPAWLKALLHWL